MVQVVYGLAICHGSRIYMMSIWKQLLLLSYGRGRTPMPAIPPRLILKASAWTSEGICGHFLLSPLWQLAVHVTLKL